MTTPRPDTTHRQLTSRGRQYTYFSLGVLSEMGYVQLDRMPHVLKILLENVLRAYEQGHADFDDVLRLATWNPQQPSRQTVPFRPARILMQDFTGVPALVDLAALRDAVVTTGGDVTQVNPRILVDLVIDHSVIVEHFASADALERNMAREFERNAERYHFLRWAQTAFDNLRIIPPGGGICHQVNLEHLAEVVVRETLDDWDTLIFPDTLIGTDSHTTMANALGVVGWGVGGIEAEGAMLGRAVEVPVPQVIGVRLGGRPGAGVGATDIVLTLTEVLRREDVVGAFIEFCGEGLDALALPDRATLANMAPEFGATCAFFAVDDQTLDYLRATGRSADHVALVEAYAKAQGWWRHGDTPWPEYSRVIDLNLAAVSACLAGPRRPQDRVVIADLEASFRTAFSVPEQTRTRHVADSRPYAIEDGSIVVAAITSCTNTSNPAAMITAGLLAKNAVDRGLRCKPWVTPSFSPGSLVVGDYLHRLGLQPALDALGFRIAAFGCAACVGNTAPLDAPLAAAIEEYDLHVAAVLSGNRNFAGRINPLIKANYLASPALVIAYALAGTLCIDLTRDPLGIDDDAEPVFLRDIWPCADTVLGAMAQATTPQMYRTRYNHIFDGSPAWQALPTGRRLTYDWSDASTYIRRPPFFERSPSGLGTAFSIESARVLLLLGDGITTDHISPAGPIGRDGPAAVYLRERQVSDSDFNSFGARRANHEIMVRGAFGNPQLHNEMLVDRLGGCTRFLPDGRIMPVFEAAALYRQHATPLLIVAGKAYGGGSSRDWAAKATALLGVRAVIAESFERIHRANLVAVGVLPLQFPKGVSWRSLGLTGTECLALSASSGALTARGRVTLTITRQAMPDQMVDLASRIDTEAELEIFKRGGLLRLLQENFCSPPVPDREKRPRGQGRSHRRRRSTSDEVEARMKRPGSI